MTTGQRSSGATAVLVVVVFLIAVIVFGAGTIGYQALMPPERDELAIWCKGHTGHFPGTSGSVSELEHAQASPTYLLGAAFTWGGSLGGGPPDTGADGNWKVARADVVNQKYAPEPVAETAHRYGRAIVDAVDDPSRLHDPAVRADAEALDAWAHANCTRPEDQGP